MPLGLRVTLGLAALAAASAGALLVVGCGSCPPFLEPGTPHRVVLLEQYSDTATFTGFDEAFATSDLAMPSCGSLDGLATTTTPTVVPGANERGAETCYIGASLAIPCLAVALRGSSFAASARCHRAPRFPASKVGRRSARTSLRRTSSP